MRVESTGTVQLDGHEMGEFVIETTFGPQGLQGATRRNMTSRWMRER
jgi:hypothetical protein